MGDSTFKIAPGVWVHVHFKSFKNPNPLQGVPCLFEERYLGFSGGDQPSIPHTFQDSKKSRHAVAEANSV